MTIEQQQHDEIRARIAELKKNTYPLIVLFFIIKSVIGDLDFMDDLDEEQTDTIIFNTMIDKIEEHCDND